MQKLESLGQLTGGVAHDFNNLLMAVLGNLELAKKYLPEDRRVLRLIDGAIQGAERGAALTKRMLAFARRQELRPEAVHIDKLVDRMIEMLRRSLGPTIQIAIDFETGLAPVLVDPNQLELALLNLAVNARDAMPFGGELRISGRWRGRSPGSPRVSMSASA
jgi:signal transduction histidine kinase